MDGNSKSGDYFSISLDFRLVGKSVLNSDLDISMVKQNPYRKVFIDSPVNQCLLVS